MQINSFCVVVSMYGFTIEHTRAMNLTKANFMFRGLTRRYHTGCDVALEWDTNYDTGSDPYSNDWIDHLIKTWKGNVDFISPWVLGLAQSSTVNGVKVELVHSSRA